MKEISAGGVVYRRNGSQLEIQLIQDRYGKISLPKGKLEPGETTEQAALREIWEETGIKGRIVEPIRKIGYAYTHSSGAIVDKEVHYFLVEAVGGTLQTQEEEIHGAAWYAPADAWQTQLRFGYDNNNAVLRAALDKLEAEVNGDD